MSQAIRKIRQRRDASHFIRAPPPSRVAHDHVATAQGSRKPPHLAAGVPQAVAQLRILDVVGQRVHHEHRL
jgi:hypothetical protein